MRSLQWLHRKLGAVRVEGMPVERERLRLAERRSHVVDEFERRGLAKIVVETEWPEIIRVDSGNEAQFHPSAEHLIDNRYLLGQAERMIEGNDVAHRTDTHATGARAGTHRIEAWRRHPTFIGAEVMLDAKRVVEVKPVAQFELAPELLVALMRR